MIKACSIFFKIQAGTMIRDLGSGGAVQKLFDHTVAATKGADVET